MITAASKRTTDSCRGLGDAFDSIASSYDKDTADNPIFRLMRETNLEYVRSAFKEGDKVLEIGCGTGDEAVELAKAGIRVVATDVSQRMLDETRRKAKLHCAEIETIHLPSGRLAELGSTFGKERFDGAYSSFGALNCETDLGKVDESLARLLKPGGLFLSSTMNRHALFEIASNLAIMRPKEAFRRAVSPAAASIGEGLSVTVRYYTPGGFASFFRHFMVEDYRALGLFLPPPYQKRLRERQRLLNILDRMDDTFRSVWPLSSLGDHTMMRMRRT